MYSVNLTEPVIPDATYFLYDKGGHAPHWEGSERFNKELAEFALGVAA